MERFEKKCESLKMCICVEYHSILYKNKNSAYLKESAIRPMFQAP